jgi:predicted dehydrogenase
MKRIKTGVVGVGALGQHHLKWYSQIETSDLVGFYEIDKDRAGQFADKHNVTAFDSLEALAEAVDAVSVVVPTSAHHEVATQLIERGVHCLIEKPVTATLEEGQELCALAEKSGVTVSVGQIERFNPAVRALDGIDIRPSFIEAHRLAAFDPRGTDVAVVLDLMIHDIDLALNFIRSPVTNIQASAVNVISEKPDIANARLTFENGAVANLTASRISLQAMRKLRIFQPSGYYSLDLARKQADIYRLADAGEQSEGMRLPLGKSGKDVVYVKRGDTDQDMLGAELTAFIETILENKPPSVSLDEGLEALRVALEVERIGRESARRVLEAQPT